jgi:peptidoglycan/LPS O-acetylase OafA/YrhL
MPGTPTPPPNKLLGLEALRFLAAFAVLSWHYQHFAYVADNPVGLLWNQLPFFGLLQPLYQAGRYGVWVFWCISGFIFFWKYRDAISDRSMPGRTFLVYRLSRLYPLHAVTFLIVALLQAVYFRLHGYFFVYQNNDLQHFLLQIFMASDWVDRSGNSFNGPIWSISVEVLVYIAFFLMLRFVTRSAWLNVVVIALSLNVSGEVFSCLAFFYAGGLAAIARQSLNSARMTVALERVAWCVVIVVPVSISAFAWQSWIVDWVLLLSYTPILLFALTGRIALPVPVAKSIEIAGNMTYSSYLLHFPIQLLIALGFAMSGRPIPFYDGWFFLGFVTATLVAAALTYRYFEAPAQAWLRTTLLAERVAALPQAQPHP